jgi:hypothetical protein
MKRLFVFLPFLVALLARSAVAGAVRPEGRHADSDALVRSEGESGSSPSRAAWGRRPPPMW